MRGQGWVGPLLVEGDDALRSAASFRSSDFNPVNHNKRCSVMHKPYVRSSNFLRESTFNLLVLTQASVGSSSTSPPRGPSALVLLSHGTLTSAQSLLTSTPFFSAAPTSSR